MKTDVVLLPGLHGSVALFESFVALAPPWARCRPVALPSDGAQTFSSLAERLAPALQSLEGFVLVAESFSGPIASRLTRILGTKVCLLVLCNPLTVAPVRLPARLSARLMRSAFCPAWAVSLAMAGSDSELGQHILREVRNLPASALEQRLNAAFAAVGQDIAEHVSAPLLAILGTGDRLIPPFLSRPVLSAVPYSTLVELKAPHLVVQAKPAEVWAAITAEFETAA